MSSSEELNNKRISIDLPVDLIAGVDELRKEWGLRARGAVFERLLEEILLNESNSEEILEQQIIPNKNLNDDIGILNQEKVDNINYSENKSLVIVGNNDITFTEIDNTREKVISNSVKHKFNNKQGIDLPGFVSKRTISLRESLGKTNLNTQFSDTYVKTVKSKHIAEALDEVNSHWQSLYGNNPGENVLEASMIWLARDIWPHIEGTESIPFTWSAASRKMLTYCQDWAKQPPTFKGVIVTAGVLEDPFSSNSLKSRIPTLVRRFVNRFKRSNVTSFKALESTMTVHGALKILGLPTLAGSSLKLSDIREAYKGKALSNHPDAGGSNEAMRKLNEGYQLLKDLYKER